MRCDVCKSLSRDLTVASSGEVVCRPCREFFYRKCTGCGHFVWATATTVIDGVVWCYECLKKGGEIGCW